jgi:hypothetical protein
MDKNIIDYIQNPRGAVLRKYLFEILKEKYVKYDDLIERLSYTVKTEKDVNLFSDLIKDVYEMAYNKAVDDYKTQLKALGYNVKVDYEKSG